MFYTSVVFLKSQVWIHMLSRIMLQMFWGYSWLGGTRNGRRGNRENLTPTTASSLLSLDAHSASKLISLHQGGKRGVQTEQRQSGGVLGFLSSFFTSSWWISFHQQWLIPLLSLGRKGLVIGEGQGKGVLFSSKQNREGRRKPPKCQALQKANEVRV